MNRSALALLLVLAACGRLTGQIHVELPRLFSCQLLCSKVPAIPEAAFTRALSRAFGRDVSAMVESGKIEFYGGGGRLSGVDGVLMMLFGVVAKPLVDPLGTARAASMDERLTKTFAEHRAVLTVSSVCADLEKQKSIVARFVAELIDADSGILLWGAAMQPVPVDDTTATKLRTADPERAILEREVLSATVLLREPRALDADALVPLVRRAGVIDWQQRATFGKEDCQVRANIATLRIGKLRYVIESVARPLEGVPDPGRGWQHDAIRAHKGAMQISVFDDFRNPETRTLAQDRLGKLVAELADESALLLLVRGIKEVLRPDPEVKQALSGGDSAAALEAIVTASHPVEIRRIEPVK